MNKATILAALVSGLYAALIANYPFTGLTPEVLFISWLILSILVLSLVAAGKKIAKDFDRNTRFAYGIAFGIFSFALMGIGYLLLPEFMSENGRVLVENGHLTLGGLFRILFDSFLVATAVFVHGLIVLVIARKSSG